MLILFQLIDTDSIIFEQIPFLLFDAVLFLETFIINSLLYETLTEFIFYIKFNISISKFLPTVKVNIYNLIISILLLIVYNTKN